MAGLPAAAQKPEKASVGADSGKEYVVIGAAGDLKAAATASDTGETWSASYRWYELDSFVISSGVQVHADDRWELIASGQAWHGPGPGACAFSLTPPSGPISHSATDAGGRLFVDDKVVANVSLIMPIGGLAATGLNCGGISGFRPLEWSRVPIAGPDSPPLRALGCKLRKPESSCTGKLAFGRIWKKRGLRVQLTVSAAVSATRSSDPNAFPGIPTPPLAEAKTFTKYWARDDLPEAWEEAKPVCGYTTAGLALQITGGVLGGTIAGGIVAATGGELLAFTAPLCGPLIQRIALDIATIDDPPLVGTHSVARPAAVSAVDLPSCGRWAGVVRTYCEQLRGALQQFALAVARRTEIARAIATSIGRLSTATKQGDTAAVSLQRRTLVSLVLQLARARQEEEADAVGVANVLGAAGVAAPISKEQSSKEIATVLSKLVARGVDATAARKYAGKALTPTASDFGTEISNGKVAAPVARPPGAPPPAAGAAITSVRFSGSPANPSFVVRGTGLGKLPAPNPPEHPAGRQGCPAIASDDGYDYGTSLYVESVSKGLAGGRYRPSLNELDCIDLVVTKFTPTEVDFHFGPFYAQNYAKFALNPGDVVRVVVNGASVTVHVKYGATATS